MSNLNINEIIRQRNIDVINLETDGPLDAELQALADELLAEAQFEEDIEELAIDVVNRDLISRAVRGEELEEGEELDFDEEEFLRPQEQEEEEKADLLIIDTDEDTDEDLQDLADELILSAARREAISLGAKNVHLLTDAEVKEKILTLKRVRAEGLTRLEFDEDRSILLTDENVRILTIEPVESNITRRDVLRKLIGYKKVSSNNTNNRRWTRFINKKDGLLRTGGFPIRNDPDEEFIVLKNVSKKFTLSINKNDVVLFEKIPKRSLDFYIPGAQRLIRKYRNKNGKKFVALKGDFSDLKESSSMAGLTRLTGLSRGSLGKNFRENNLFQGNYLLFKMSAEEFRQLTNEVRLINRIPTITDIDPEVLREVNKYY